MMQTAKIFFIKALLILLFILPGAALAYPPAYTEKIDSTPDLLQMDRRNRLPGRGKQYCAPVAASNSLIWLAANGFPDLVPEIAGKKMTQSQLALELSMARYMDTSLKHGTTVTEFLIGIGRFMGDRGFPYAFVSYQGWREHPSAFTTGVTVPETDWIKEGLVGDSAVWLNVGWYTHDTKTDIYSRIGGHYVTLVGYGVDKDGKKAPNILIIHDPANWAKKGPKGKRPKIKNDYVLLEKINSGKMGLENSKDLHDAAGYYKVSGDMAVQRKADLAILDGALVLRLSKMKPVLINLKEPPGLK